MDQSHSLEQLALQISSLAYTFSKYMKNSETQKASSNGTVPTQPGFPADLPDDVRDAKEQLIEAAGQLQDLILGPADKLRRMATEWANPATLRWIVHFKIPQHVPSSGSISYTGLATSASVPESQLRRILRYAMTNDVFSEPEPGRVAHTRLSTVLASSAQMQDYVGHCLEFSFPVAVRMAEMTERWAGSDDKTHTAFNLTHDSPLPMFAWMKGQPEHADRFGRLMAAMHSSPAYHVKHLVDGWDWSQLGSDGKVVDVGGSGGHCSVALAERFPGLKFVVQDLEYVVEQSKVANALPDGVRDRVCFMQHDFFNKQPVRDGDVYLLRQILHDWPDDSAIQILKNTIPSLKTGAKILVMDQVVPAPGTLLKAKEKEARTVDLVVMSHFNGKQRDMEDWRRIFEAVDPDLKIEKVMQPNGSVFAIIQLGLDKTSDEAPAAEPKQEENGVGQHVPNSDDNLEDVNGAAKVELIKGSSNMQAHVVDEPTNMEVDNGKQP